MEQAIEIYGKKPLTAAQIKAQVQLIQEVMEAVMKKDHHYGIIPGTPKPTLYKPGAEKLLSTFHIGADPSEFITDLSTEDEIRYRVAVKGFSQAMGNLLGVGIGECSSNEEKYKWRKPICNEEFEETSADRKRIVWKKIEGKPTQLKQVRMVPSDVANTILKMAKKRALIDMTLTITAASDIFDQDLEDLPEGMGVGLNGKPPIGMPKEKKGESPKSKDTETLITLVDNVTMKEGKNDTGKAWTKYTIHVRDKVYSTFDKNIAKDADQAKKSAVNVNLEFKNTTYGPEIVSLTIQEPPEPGSEG